MKQFLSFLDLLYARPWLRILLLIFAAILFFVGTLCTSVTL